MYFETPASLLWPAFNLLGASCVDETKCLFFCFNLDVCLLIRDALWRVSGINLLPQIQAHWYVFWGVCLLWTSQGNGWMRSHVGLLQRKICCLAGILWMVTRLPVLPCTALWRAVNLWHTVALFCTRGIWNTQSVTHSLLWSHRGYYSVDGIFMMFVSWRLSLEELTSVTPTHTHFHLTTHLFPASSHSLPNTVYSLFPSRARQQSGMPSTSPHPPLRGADVTPLLPSDSVTHINMFSHQQHTSPRTSSWALIVYVLRRDMQERLCFCLKDCGRDGETEMLMTSIWRIAEWMSEGCYCCPLTLICCYSNPQHCSKAGLFVHSSQSLHRQTESSHTDFFGRHRIFNTHPD